MFYFKYGSTGSLLVCLFALSGAQIRMPIAVQKRPIGSSNSWKQLDSSFSTGMLQLDDDSAVPLIDTYDTFYIASIGLGTPAQPFDVNMDTGSSELWVADSSCSVCDNSIIKFKFAETESSTYMKNGTRFTYMYGLGEARGYLGMDQLTIAGLKVRNQTFGQANYIDSSFQTQPNDGILGLGFPSLAGNGVTPPVQNMANQGLIKRAMFSVWMEHQRYLEGSAGGEIIFGGTDERYYSGPIYYQPVVQAQYWQIKMDGMQINNQIVKKSGGYNVIVDTGTSFLIGPPDAVGTIISNIPGAFQSQGFNLISCSVDRSRLPVIYLIFQGRKFSIQGYNYVIDQNLVGNICILAVQAGNVVSGLDWILGDTFIREWYQVFDFDKRVVGFAKAYADYPVRHRTLYPETPESDAGRSVHSRLYHVITVLGCIFNCAMK